MGDDPTLLGYQTSYEYKVFELFTNSQQMGDYGMACMYGEALLDFLGSDLPQKPIAKDQKEIRSEPIMYYEVLFKTVLRKIRINILTIRRHYQKEVKIPQIVKQTNNGANGNGS